MRTAGLVLSWLVGSAIVGMLTFLVAFLSANASSRTQALGSLGRLFSGIASPMLFIALASEALALMILVVGVACWRSQVFRNPRWMLSSLGMVIVAAVLLGTIYISVVIAGSNI